MMYPFRSSSLSKSLAVLNINNFAFWSEVDQVNLVKVICDQCGNHYDELQERALECVALGQTHVCIKCDSSAKKRVGRIINRGLSGWSPIQ